MAFSMRRILTVLAVALLVATMLAVTAAPAFAYHAPGHVGLADYHDRKEGVEYCLGISGTPGVENCTISPQKAKGPK